MPITRYPLETGEIDPINAKLLYVTHSIYENDWPSLPHMHYFTELCYIKTVSYTHLDVYKRQPLILS